MVALQVVIQPVMLLGKYVNVSYNQTEFEQRTESKQPQPA